MSELLAITACVVASAAVFYHRHAINAAYYEGMYREHIDAQGWNKLQIELAYQRGAKDGIDYCADRMTKLMRQAYIDGRQSIMQANFYQHN